jgi:hypothetical protein
VDFLDPNQVAPNARSLEFTALDPSGFQGQKNPAALNATGLVLHSGQARPANNGDSSASFDAQHHQCLVEQLIGNLTESHRALQLANGLAFKLAEKEVQNAIA